MPQIDAERLVFVFADKTYGLITFDIGGMTLERCRHAVDIDGRIHFIVAVGACAKPAVKPGVRRAVGIAAGCPFADKGSFVTGILHEQRVSN